MKLKGVIRGKGVVVLIDSGATHNFIHNRTVEEKNMTLEEGTPFAVTVGDDTQCTGKGICKSRIGTTRSYCRGCFFGN